MLMTYIAHAASGRPVLVGDAVLRATGDADTKVGRFSHDEMNVLNGVMFSVEFISFDLFRDVALQILAYMPRVSSGLSPTSPGDTEARQQKPRRSEMR